jgi:hypothetical protein
MPGSQLAEFRRVTPVPRLNRPRPGEPPARRPAWQPGDTDRFIGVIAGTIPITEFFAPGNIQRLSPPAPPLNPAPAGDPRGSITRRNGTAVGLVAAFIAYIR